METKNDKTKPIVLVVDDSVIVRKQIAYELAKRDINIIEANNGLEAFGQLLLTGGEIDLIILDMNMDTMNGLQFVTRYTKTEYKRIPIAVSTAQSNLELKETIKSLGVSMWAQKPLKASFFDAIKKVVSK